MNKQLVSGELMDNYILDKQADWRYCNVRTNEKRPYPNNWQNMPKELHEIESKNIGLILGPASGGTCAIDFDGPSAFIWAETNGIDLANLPITPTWSSGRPGRCQMAFRVPKEAWDILATKKILTKPASAPGAGDGEGFEFRWTGGQSVLPPSVHPDTGKPYEWWVDAMEPMADIPESILRAWLNYTLPPRAPSTLPEVKLDDLDEKKVAQVNEILEIVKGRHPTLSYTDWCSVSWGVAKELGREAGEVLMREYYPEQEPGEYTNIYRNYNVAKSPSMGTVRKMYAGIPNKKEKHAEKYQEYLRQQEEIQQLEQKIREMTNGKK